MKRFVTVTVDNAIRNGYPGAPPIEELDHWDGYGHSYLYETDGTRPTRLVGRDGGEPEDNLFIRDWSWVETELNRLAEGKS